MDLNNQALDLIIDEFVDQLNDKIDFNSYFEDVDGIDNFFVPKRDQKISKQFEQKKIKLYHSLMGVVDHFVNKNGAITFYEINKAIYKTFKDYTNNSEMEILNKINPRGKRNNESFKDVLERYGFTIKQIYDFKWDAEIGLIKSNIGRIYVVYKKNNKGKEKKYVYDNFLNDKDFIKNTKHITFQKMVDNLPGITSQYRKHLKKSFFLKDQYCNKEGLVDKQRALLFKQLFEDMGLEEKKRFDKQIGWYNDHNN